MNVYRWPNSAEQKRLSPSGSISPSTRSASLSMVFPEAFPSQTSCCISFFAKCSATKDSASTGKNTGSTSIMRFMNIRTMSSVITNAITTASSRECAA